MKQKHVVGAKRLLGLNAKVCKQSKLGFYHDTYMAIEGFNQHWNLPTHRRRRRQSKTQKHDTSAHPPYLSNNIFGPGYKYMHCYIYIFKTSGNVLDHPWKPYLPLCLSLFLLPCSSETADQEKRLHLLFASTAQSLK